MSYNLHSGSDPFSLSILVVVFLSVDVTAGNIEAVVESESFSCAHLAVGFCSSFGQADPCLLGGKSSGFSSGKFVASDAPLNSMLLVLLAPIDRIVGISCVGAWRIKGF
jgi:hypothetical protein